VSGTEPYHFATASAQFDRPLRAAPVTKKADFDVVLDKLVLKVGEK
jgi:hypothetical protein